MSRTRGPRLDALFWRSSTCLQVRAERVVRKQRCFEKGIRIRIGIKSSDSNFGSDSRGRIGWGGRIRTFTILINSEVSYRLDHAPAEGNTARGDYRSK